MPKQFTCSWRVQNGNDLLTQTERTQHTCRERGIKVLYYWTHWKFATTEQNMISLQRRCSILFNRGSVAVSSLMWMNWLSQNKETTQISAYSRPGNDLESTKHIINRLSVRFPTTQFEIVIDRNKFTGRDDVGVNIAGGIEVPAAWYWYTLFGRLGFYAAVYKRKWRELRDLLCDSDSDDDEEWFLKSDKDQHIVEWDLCEKDPTDHLAMLSLRTGVINTRVLMSNYNELRDLVQRYGKYL